MLQKGLRTYSWDSPAAALIVRPGSIVFAHSAGRQDLYAPGTSLYLAGRRHDPKAFELAVDFSMREESLVARIVNSHTRTFDTMQAISAVDAIRLLAECDRIVDTRDAVVRYFLADEYVVERRERSLVSYRSNPERQTVARLLAGVATVPRYRTSAAVKIDRHVAQLVAEMAGYPPVKRHALQTLALPASVERAREFVFREHVYESCRIVLSDTVCCTLYLGTDVAMMSVWMVDLDERRARDVQDMVQSWLAGDRTLKAISYLLNKDTLTFEQHEVYPSRQGTVAGRVCSVQ